jgi:hypothetical protein
MDAITEVIIDTIVRRPPSPIRPSHILMAESYKVQPPFYDRNSPPPPALPLLVAQTDLYAYVLQPSPLVAQDSLPKAITVLRKVSKPECNASTVKNRLTRVLDQWSSFANDSSESDNGKLSTDCEEDQLESEDGNITSDSAHLIKKPAGEAGRPGRGGYSLDQAMGTHGWDGESLKKLKVCHTIGNASSLTRSQAFVNNLVAKHLDESLTFSGQKPHLILTVQDAVRGFSFQSAATDNELQATEKFPTLEDFAGLWPLTDLVKLRLHYTSTQMRKKAADVRAPTPGPSKKVRTRAQDKGKGKVCHSTTILAVH